MKRTLAYTITFYYEEEADVEVEEVCQRIASDFEPTINWLADSYTGIATVVCAEEAVTEAQWQAAVEAEGWDQD